MLEFANTEKNDRMLKINTDLASFVMDQPANGLFTVTVGDLTVSTRNAVLNEYGEELSLDGIRKVHVAESGLELGVDMESSIPFGAEPEISRRYRVQEDFLEVVSDLILRNSFEMKNIVAGGLEFSGDIAFISCLPFDGTSSEFKKPERISAEQIADGDVILDSSFVPLSLELEDSRGTCLKFMPGEDYWRWIHAAKIQGSSRYLIRKEQGKIIFEWQLYHFVPANDEDLPPGGRNWRLSWLLQWQSGKSGTVLPETCKAWIDLSTQNWRKEAKVQLSDGTCCDVPCVSSAVVLNQLKKWFRSNMGKAEAGDVYAVIADSHICYAAAHLNRAKQKVLPHRDDIALLKFKRWANRQLAASGAKLVILDKISK